MSSQFSKIFRLQLLPILAIGFLAYSCGSAESYKQDLSSGDKIKIMSACYELGERKDTSAVRLLLTNILDPRMTNYLRFKGMSVNYCRIGALGKISGIPYRQNQQLFLDTAATFFYLDWAVSQGYIKDRKQINIYYP